MIAEKIYSANHCYQIRERLGEGGYGSVYLARCLEDGCLYALKVSLEDAVSKNVLRHEGSILVSVCHPSFPSVKEIWETERLVYLVMTFISGRSLSVKMQERMLQYGRGFEPDEILPWMIQLADSLDYLCRHRIVYSDLKPSNVMMDVHGQTFLIDFGAAVMLDDVQEQMQAGTPGFAPPEQYSHTSRPGAWTDVYSFGALLHFLLTGIHPASNMFGFQNLKGCDQPDDRLKGGERFYKVRQMRSLNHLIRSCTQMNPGKRCSWDDIRRTLYFCRSSEMRRNVIWFERVILGALAVFLGVYLGLSVMERRLIPHTYEQYMRQAEAEEPENAEAALLKGIEVMPGRADGYLALLDLYMMDEVLTVEEWQQIQQLWMIHSETMEADAAEWVIFSYRIGMAIYLQSDRMISENQASVWFQRVEEADIGRMNLGTFDSRKLIWQKRAAIFRRWSQLCTGSSAKENLSADENQRFWHEAESLLEDEFYPEESLWELGMYNQLLNRMMEELTVGLKNRHVSKRTVCIILDRIDNYIGEEKEEETLTEKKQDILDKVKILRKRLTMVDEK